MQFKSKSGSNICLFLIPVQWCIFMKTAFLVAKIQLFFTGYSHMLAVVGLVEKVFMVTKTTIVISCETFAFPSKSWNKVIYVHIITLQNFYCPYLKNSKFSFFVFTMFWKYSTYVWCFCTWIWCFFKYPTWVWWVSF